MDMNAHDHKLDGSLSAKRIADRLEHERSCHPVENAGSLSSRQLADLHEQWTLEEVAEDEG